MRQAVESGKEETTADFGHTAIRVYFTDEKFSAHAQWLLAHINNGVAWAAKKTRSHYNQIGPLDNKMDDICVSLACRNTIFSTITRLIKS